MWRSAVTVDRQTATVWRTTDGQSFGTRPLVNFHFDIVTFIKNVASSDKRGHRHMKIVWLRDDASGRPALFSGVASQRCVICFLRFAFRLSGCSILNLFKVASKFH